MNNSQIHASAALLTAKELLYPLNGRLGEPQSYSEFFLRHITFSFAANRNQVWSNPWTRQ
jgi:hypothetical protein